jgi:hypothetical protein
MYQVQAMLSCTDMNVFTARNIALLPQKGQKVICKICGDEHTVLLVGKPYQIKDKKPTRK